ncbi:MAG: diguanylate cyclase/phosphodiesterase with sensor(s) [Rhodocyclaceae bacterium]|nr:diguanylate cyclase/phosphodiesterase with sensor(s) [Rhodocyclaceae bacterium]
MTKSRLPIADDPSAIAKPAILPASSLDAPGLMSVWIMAGFAAILATLAWRFPVPMAGLSREAALALQVVAETLYVAGAVLALASHSAVLSNRLRWGMLWVSLVCVLHGAWVAAQPGILPAAYGPGEDSPALPGLIRSMLVGSLILAAVFSARRRDNDDPGLRYLVLAALLAAGAEACFIPGPDAATGLNLLGHAYGLLGLGAAYLSASGKGADSPRCGMDSAGPAAPLEKEAVETILNAIADGVVVVDRQLGVLSMNPVACHLIGLSEDEIPDIGLGSVLETLDATSASSILGELEYCLGGGQAPAAAQYCTLRSLSGGHYAVQYAVSSIPGDGGAPRGAVLVLRDVTEMQQVRIQLQFQATCDPLTALPNRRIFRERVQQAMARARRKGRLAAIMLIDLDDFKDVNDSLGHAVGDDLLKGMALRLAESLGETDTVARIGGDEFGVLVEDLAQVEDIQPLADKVLEAAAAPLCLEGHEVTVNCSIGVSVLPVDSDDADTLLRNADTAMFAAKESGKSACRYYTDDMNAVVQRRVHLGNRLRNALLRSEFSLHYQPQVDLDSGAVVGVEALIRWNSEDLGCVSPAEFIPIAEASGQIVPIGDWVLAEACRQAALWYRQSGHSLSVAVNISARQFRDSDIVGSVTRVLAETGLPVHLLELELTESMLMRDAARAAETLARLKEIGVRIAIDDFGTGYSSLSYLKRFPIDHLKVDRSFVIDISGSQHDRAIVCAIVALAHNLGLKVIAEGAETAEQMAFLQKLGCDQVQGYYVSRPRPAADVPGFLRDWDPLELRMEAAPAA